MLNEEYIPEAKNHVDKININAELRSLRVKNLNKLIIGHLNINSLRNKFELLTHQIKDNIDILMISETKLDESFPTSEFFMKGFSSLHCLDRNCNGGGIILYIRENIPSKLLSIALSIDSSYMADFRDTYDLRSLITEPTCYKNPENQTCIDLILTSHPLSFRNSCVLETGLSDFHKMTVTIMKASFQRLQPRIINYRDYRRFQNDVFREELLSELLNVSIGENEEGFSNFLDICKKHVNYHAPCKQKYAQGNNLPFMNKTLSKEIMKRTRFRNKFLKNKNDYSKREFSKQRNYYVSLVRKSKKL